MYYGFNKETGRCQWSIDMEPVVPENIVMLQSDETLDICKIQLGKDDNGNDIIVDIVYTEKELLEEAKQKHVYEMETAKTQIDTLNDVVEFTPSEEAEAKLLAWRKYRAELYGMDFTSLDTVVWPKSPDAKD